MEETQRYSIAFKGLKNGHHEFRFAVDKSLFEAFENTEIKDGACEVRVDLNREESQLVLDVSISGHVVVACDRCLEDCRIPIDFEGRLLVKFSDEVREYDGEVLWLLPGEEQVDLAQYIYESIVLVSDREFSAIEAQAAARGHNDGEWAKLAALREQMVAETSQAADAADPEREKQ